MSTYQGERYVDEQIRSILDQTWKTLSLVIRDDGSADATPDGLRAHMGSSRLRVEFGSNIGLFASFLRLLAHADPAATFYAFSDQDDHWMPDKVETAVNWFNAQPDQRTPLLYCGRQIIADRNLRAIGKTPAWPRAPDWRNALVENIATGCTIVLNRPARDLILAVPMPSGLRYHDWWCYLVVSAFGRVHFDDVPHVLYRQHGRNSLGVGSTPISRYLRKLSGSFSTGPLSYACRQAAEFRRLYDRSLSNVQRTTIDRLTTPSTFRAAVVPGVWRQFLLDDLVLRSLYLSKIIKVGKVSS